MFARTFSATTRHIMKPEDTKKTLCGGRIALREHYIGDDGQPKTADPSAIRDLPPCQRCEKSAAKRGLTTTDQPAADTEPEPSLSDPMYQAETILNAMMNDRPAEATPAATHTADLEVRGGAAMVTVAPWKRGPYTEYPFTPQTGDPRAEAAAILTAAGWQIIGDWANLGGGFSRIGVRVTVKGDRDPDRSTVTVQPGDVVTLAGIPGRSTGMHTDMTVTEVDRDPDGAVTVRYVGPGGYRDTVTADLDAFTVTVTGQGSTRCACPPEVKVSGHWPSCRLCTLTLDECRVNLSRPVRRIQVIVEAMFSGGRWATVDEVDTATHAHTENDFTTIADEYAAIAGREYGPVRVSVWCRCCFTAAYVERGRAPFPAGWIPTPPVSRGAQALAA